VGRGRLSTRSPARRTDRTDRTRTTEETRMSAESFQGRIGRTAADSEPWWPPEPRPRDGAPNVVIVVFDDVGFAQWGCYGSTLKTPRLDALAAAGLRYLD